MRGDRGKGSSVYLCVSVRERQRERERTERAQGGAWWSETMGSHLAKGQKGSEKETTGNHIATTPSFKWPLWRKCRELVHINIQKYENKQKNFDTNVFYHGCSHFCRISQTLLWAILPRWLHDKDAYRVWLVVDYQWSMSRNKTAVIMSYCSKVEV